MYKLKYSLTINNKSFEQDLFINKEMVLVSVNNKWNVFIKKQNKNYNLNFDSKRLSAIDFSNFIGHKEAISKLFGEIKIEKKEKEEILGYTSQKYEYNNLKDFPNLHSKISIGSIKDLDKTCYLEYFNYEKTNQIIDIHISNGDLLMYNMTSSKLPQGNLMQIIELISISELNFSPELLEILNYPILID